MAALAALAALAVKIGVVDREWRGGATTASDTTRIAVLPLEVRGSIESATLHDDLLHDALSRWRGIELIDQFRVAEAARRRPSIATHEAAAALAASLGAGRYVRGTLQRDRDSVRVAAGLFEIADGPALQTARATVGFDGGGAAVAYARLARTLLLRGAAADESSDTASAPRSVPALQAFGRAQRALDEWDLAAADSALEAAIAYDSEYARANFWLAQVRAWRELPATSWQTLAARARAGTPPVPEREQRLAEALVLLGEGRFAEACATYEQLRQRNERDFAAWFGLGQCRTMDRLVVQDATSPSGWRFRSSYHRAMEAYARAFEVLPTVHRGYERGAYENLRVLLLLTTSLVPGRDATGRVQFQARPGWRGDTLVLVPYAWQAVYSGDPSSIPTGFTEAIARQRERFRRIAATWSAAFPQSAGAKHAVALSLEVSGNAAAIDTMRLARLLAGDSLKTVELAAAEVLLLLKFGLPGDTVALTRAAALADSLLQAVVPESPQQAEILAALASVRGQCAIAEDMARRAVPARTSHGVSPELRAEAEALLARTALGCPERAGSPTLRGVAAEIDRRHAGQGGDEVRHIDLILLFRPLLLASVLDSVVAHRLAGSGDMPLLAAARAASHQDWPRVRDQLRAFSATWNPIAGPVTPDMALPGAQLWLAAGDTLKAIEWLDRTLHAIREYDPGLLADPALVAALIRAMRLRSQVSPPGEGPEQARAWGIATSLLWANHERGR